MATFPLVSIGVPNFNYSRYICFALNSIVEQSYQNIEIIIVDDCSTDNSITVIENWIYKYSGGMHIKFIKNKSNLGLTEVCNIVLENSRGKYFQTLDADDLLLPGKIERQVELLEENANAAFIYSDIGLINETGKIIKKSYLQHIRYDENKMPAGNIFKALFNFNFVPLPSVLVNTAMARSVGGFDETLQVQDYYLWLQLAEKNEVIFLKENTALYRMHSTSMSNSNKTNPRSVDSVLQIKYRYYQKSSAAIKKIIRKDILFSAVYLYENKYASAGYWLKKNLLLNFGFKSVVYFFANKAGIPFSFFNSIKQKLTKSHPVNE